MPTNLIVFVLFFLGLGKKKDMMKLLIKEKMKLTTCEGSGKNALEVFLTEEMCMSSREKKDFVHLLVSSGAKIEFM